LYLRFLVVVCILDGRKKEFDVEKVIFTLASKLPRFSSEIPYGSIALVGYTVALWGEHFDKLSLSINWAVVLATPSNASSSKLATSSKAKPRVASAK
jgi:hypothetical protein